MKKRIIAVSVAAAMGGFVGTASAQTTATTLQFNPAGVGHILYVPYFSTQNGNVTAINIVNTDTKNGKALKVRFRGASNSDDVYDFQVFLSPGDVWTAGISNDNGLSRLDTVDKSCTLPSNVNGQFIISRTLGPAAVDRPAETREGYVEILNMGDIVSDGSSGTSITNKQRLYNATKHVNGVAPCTASVMTALTNENASTYLSNPTTGLMANWTIINVQGTVAAYSGDASSIEARVSAGGLPGAGNIVYWDQRSIPLSCGEADANTADPLLRCSGISTTNTTPWVAGARYDLPDLSTPYTSGTTTPAAQARELSDAIATVEAAGEFYNLASVSASTDWVVSFPTRRYGAAVRYTGTGAPAPVYNSAASNIYFTSSNTAMGTAPRAYQLCQSLGTGSVNFYNREEEATESDDIVISPGTPTVLNLCGEVAVVGINAGAPLTSATYGSITRSNVSNGFVEGWGSISVPSANGLPFLARQYTRVADQLNNRLYGLTYGARIITKGANAP